MPPKKVIKFGAQSKESIKGPVKHSRTGACTAKGKCFHGPNQRKGTRGGF